MWALIQACASGDLKAVRALIARDPSLARSHYDYRKPLYFAVRENRIDVVRFLIEHDCNPLDLWMDDDPIEIARDRGYTAMEQLLTHTLDTSFNASPQGEPVALALARPKIVEPRNIDQHSGNGGFGTHAAVALGDARHVRAVRAGRG